MIRLGCYFIPPEDRLYDQGSAVVGYDIRHGRAVNPPAFIRPQWVNKASEFGFHITITDAIEFHEDQLERVVQQVKTILRCLRPTNVYRLQKKQVGFWHEASDQAAILFTPSRSVELLHDVLTATIHPLGSASEYSRAYRVSPSTYFSESPSQIAKTQTFLAPYIFDEFVPHFTCIHPFDGTAQQRKAVERELGRFFADLDILAFDTLCIAVQRPGEAHFKIFDELTLRPNNF